MAPNRCLALTVVASVCAICLMVAGCTGEVGPHEENLSQGNSMAAPDDGDGEEYSTFTNYNLPLNAWVKVCNVNHGVNNRSGAGTNYMVLRVLTKGSMAQTVKRSGNWYKLEIPGGKQGWSYGRYLCPTGPATPPPAPGGGGCHKGSKFSWDYCSSSCPCGEGEGDCDSDNQCKPGLKCVHDVGASYGALNTVDVCKKASTAPPPAPGGNCHKGPKFGWDYCTAACPCAAGEGDCDSDAECKTGLKCRQDVGASYGAQSTVDVCGSGSSTPTPPPSTGGKINLSRDGIINACKAFLKFSYWWGGARFKVGSKEYGKCYSPTYGGHSGKYGADCSGFVGKVWQLPNAMPFDSNKHPYSTVSFKSGSTYWTHISRSNTKRADALVYNSGSSGHIVIYESGNAWGKAWTYESRGCSYGVVHNLRSISSSYQARRRKGI